MARRGQRFAAPIPGDADDPTSRRTVGHQYLLWLELADRSIATIDGRRRAIARFATWNLQSHANSPFDVDATTITNDRIHLHHHPATTGQRLTTRTKQQYLIAIRGLYRWLCATHPIDHDPTERDPVSWTRTGSVAMSEISCMILSPDHPCGNGVFPGLPGQR